MKKAIAIIDSWKLSIFERHLKAANYTYKILDGLTENTLTLQVEFKSVAELKPVIEAANEECAQSKLN